MDLTPDQWAALAALLFILGLGFALIPWNNWLDRRDARRRNMAHRRRR